MMKPRLRFNSSIIYSVSGWLTRRWPRTGVVPAGQAVPGRRGAHAASRRDGLRAAEPVYGRGLLPGGAVDPLDGEVRAGGRARGPDAAIARGRRRTGMVRGGGVRCRWRRDGNIGRRAPAGAATRPILQGC